MSEGKYLIYKGVVIEKLTEIIEGLNSDYVNLEEFGNDDDRYKLQPLDGLLRQLGGLLEEHQYEYVLTDKEWFDDHPNLSLKEYWKLMFDFPLPSDKFFKQKQDERDEFYRQHVEHLV